MKAQGSFVALITPFDKKGRIDWKCLEKLIIWHIQEGTDALVLFGTTGEVMSLSEGEKQKIATFSIEVAKDQIPIIANTGTADTKQTIRLTEKMARLGATACLAITPFYNRPTQRGCILHFSEVAKVGLPIILYHNPIRTGVRLTAETIANIAEIPGILGYKDATGDFELMRSIRKLSPIPIFSGDDHLTHASLVEGSIGAISVIGNLFPRDWKMMISYGLQQKWEASKSIADRLAPLCKALFLEPNPQCLKFAMSSLGKCYPHLRLPLLLPTSEVKETLHFHLRQLHLL